MSENNSPVPETATTTKAASRMPRWLFLGLLGTLGSCGLCSTLAICGQLDAAPTPTSASASPAQPSMNETTITALRATPDNLPDMIKSLCDSLQANGATIPVDQVGRCDKVRGQSASGSPTPAAHNAASQTGEAGTTRAGTALPVPVSDETRAAFRSDFGCDKVSFANGEGVCEIDGTFQANTQGVARSRGISFEVYAKNLIMQKLLYDEDMKKFLESNGLHRGTMVLYVKTATEDKFGNTVGRGSDEVARATVTLETLRKVNFQRAAEIANQGEAEFVRWASNLIE